MTWSNLLLVVVGVWAAPRCWPHVQAVVGVRDSGARVPAYAVTTRTGASITAENLRGRVVLVNVWATWCAPCRAEMPALEQLSRAYQAEGMVLLGLSVDRGPAATVDAFLADHGITYPVAIIDHAVLAAFGGVRGYPTSFLIDRAGVVRHTVMGPVAPLTLRPAVRRLLAESAPATGPVGAPSSEPAPGAPPTAAPPARMR